MQKGMNVSLAHWMVIMDALEGSLAFANDRRQIWRFTKETRTAALQMLTDEMQGINLNVTISEDKGEEKPVDIQS